MEKIERFLTREELQGAVSVGEALLKRLGEEGRDLIIATAVSTMLDCIKGINQECEYHENLIRDIFEHENKYSKRRYIPKDKLGAFFYRLRARIEFIKSVISSKTVCLGDEMNVPYIDDTLIKFKKESDDFIFMCKKVIKKYKKRFPNTNTVLSKAKKLPKITSIERRYEDD